MSWLKVQPNGISLIVASLAVTGFPNATDLGSRRAGFGVLDTKGPIPDGHYLNLQTVGWTNLVVFPQGRADVRMMIVLDQYPGGETGWLGFERKVDGRVMSEWTLKLTGGKKRVEPLRDGSLRSILASYGYEVDSGPKITAKQKYVLDGLTGFAIYEFMSPVNSTSYKYWFVEKAGLNSTKYESADLGHGIDGAPAIKVPFMISKEELASIGKTGK